MAYNNPQEPLPHNDVDWHAPRFNMIVGANPHVDEARRTGEQLYWAAKNGEFDDVKLLVRGGADVNCVVFESRRTPLMAASGKSHCAIVKCLLTKNAHVDLVDNNRDTAFTIASKRGLLDVMKRLAKANANVNHANVHGETALHHAIHRGCESVVEWLLANGVDVSRVTTSGKTALHNAYYKQVAHILLASKVDPNHQTTLSGSTALHYIASTCDDLFRYSEEVAILLLEYKADVNRVDKYGQTALLIAADSRFPQMATLLLANGADPTTQAFLGGCNQTALTWAQERGAGDVVKILSRYQTSPDSWVFDPQVVAYFPKVLYQQWIVFACLWSARLDDSTNALTPLPIELLHSLLSVLWRAYVFG